jgi:hypothetical protein
MLISSNTQRISLKAFEESIDSDGDLTDVGGSESSTEEKEPAHTSGISSVKRVKKIQGGGEAKKGRSTIVDESKEDDIADFLDDVESESEREDYEEEDTQIKSKRGASKATGKRKVTKAAVVKTKTKGVKGVVKAKGGGKKRGKVCKSD